MRPVLLLAAAALFVVNPSSSPQTVFAQSDSEGIVVPNCTVYWRDRVTLAADRPGILSAVPKRVGEVVGKEETVAKLDDRVAQAAYRKAQKQASNKVDIDYSRKNHAVAEAELEKNLDVNRILPGTVSEIEIERLRLSAQRAELQIEQAQFTYDLEQLNVAEAKAVLEQHTVMSPIAGLVTKVVKLPGEAVTQGDPILEVINAEVVRIEGELPVARLADIKRGTPVTVTIAIDSLSDVTFKGEVVLVDLFVTPVKPKVRVLADVKNENGLLREGLKTTMTIRPE